METQNLVISFDYSWFLAKNLAYAECPIVKFHYRNSNRNNLKSGWLFYHFTLLRKRPTTALRTTSLVLFQSFCSNYDEMLWKIINAILMTFLGNFNKRNESNTYLTYYLKFVDYWSRPYWWPHLHLFWSFTFSETIILCDCSCKEPIRHYLKY